MEEKIEYGVTYVEDDGTLHTEWGYIKYPVIHFGEVQTGKRTWSKVYEIKSRPVVKETSVWMSDDCPWREKNDN